jgi:type II secretory pathway component PulF
MPIYSYQAINESGVKIKGTIEADSMDSANSALVARGLIPSKVSVRVGLGQFAIMVKLLDRLLPIKAPELILFTKQFRTMIRAGVPMIVLLQTLETQTEDDRLKRIVSEIKQDISEGSSLYDAFRKFPRVFSPLYCSMIHAGEASGALAEVMDRLIHIIEHEHKIRSDIRSAMQYPAIVLSFLIVAFFVLLTYVIPKFSAIFSRSGIELPLLTRICVAMYNFIADYWYILVVVIVAIIGFTISYLKTGEGRLAKDRLILKLPLIGPLFQKAAMTRFSSIFSILQSSGVPVLESMRILTETINNSAIADELDKIAERLEEGRGISGPLRQSQYFTPIVINMTAIGEESGNLIDMLNDVAEHYDAELEYAMKRVSDSIGPILTVGLAVVIGFFALAIYMPMWELSTIAR